jgi:hypothetical protein
MCSARVQTQFGKKYDIWTFSKQKEDESEHVASLAQPPPLMCACSFSISFVRSDRNGKKEKTGEMRTKFFCQKRFSERGHSRNEI